MTSGVFIKNIKNSPKQKMGIIVVSIHYEFNEHLLNFSSKRVANCKYLTEFNEKEQRYTIFSAIATKIKLLDINFKELLFVIIISISDF